MKIQDMRAALDNLRPSRDEGPTMNIGSTPRAVERVVLDTEDIGAIATRYREEGHRAGFQAGAEETRAWQEAMRGDAVRRAETLGMMAGLTLAVAELDRRVKELVTDEAVDAAHRVGGSVDRALDTPRDRLAQMLDELQERGLYGERADQVTDLLERIA